VPSRAGDEFLHASGFDASSRLLARYCHQLGTINL
jgi:hypothetical protein